VTYIFEKSDMRKKQKDGSDERMGTQNMANIAARSWSGRGERMASEVVEKESAQRVNVHVWGKTKTIGRKAEGNTRDNQIQQSAITSEKSVAGMVMAEGA